MGSKNKNKKKRKRGKQFKFEGGSESKFELANDFENLIQTKTAQKEKALKVFNIFPISPS
jgi:hypothetical protein